MSLQETIITDFKKHFPSLSLDKSSKLLKINKTRLFRILQGQEMKVSEYESFDKVLRQRKGITHSDLYSKTKECLQTLRPEKINEILIHMQEKIQLELLIRA